MALTARAITDVQNQGSNLLNFKRFDLITINSPEVEGGYWYGSFNKQEGYVYQSDVEKVSDAFGVVAHSSANDHFGEYGIEIGDVVTIVNPYHQDWWEVQFSAKKIVYPSVFISIVDSFCIEGVGDYDHGGRNPEELSFSEGDKISKVTLVAGHDWLMGEVNGRAGLFPRNFVTFKVKPTKKAQVTVNYFACEDDELTLSVGDEVDVVEDLGNGWLKGISGNNHGVFPGSFVVFVSQKDTESNESSVAAGTGAATVENFTSDTKLSEELTCGICLDYADRAVETSCCHHIFCENCIKKVSTSCCPQCRKTYKALVAHLARRMIGEMEIVCTNKECGLKTTRSELVHHLPKCQFRNYKCSLCDEFTGLKDKLGLHLVNEHLDTTLELCKPLFS